MHLPVLSFLVVALLAPAAAMACRPKFVPLDERVESAKGIYVGVVTGQFLTGMERRLRNSGDDEIIVGPEEYELRILVRETVKGRPRTTLSVPIISCGSGWGELNDHVVVFRNRNGGNYVVAQDSVLSDVRRLLEAGR